MKGKLILLSRAVYAMAWFLIAPAVPGMLVRFGLPSSFAAEAVSSFFVATGLFQIPSAAVASKVGAKVAYSLGLVIIGMSEIALGVSSNPLQVMVFYFLTGAGASLFFSSAGGTLSRLNPGEEQRAMGAYNALFSFGGTAGLALGYLEAELGFSPVAIALGVMTALLGVLNFASHYPNLEVEFSGKGVKDVLPLSVMTSGVWGIYYLVSELFPTYVFVSYGVSPKESSLIASLMTLASGIGGAAAIALRMNLASLDKVVSLSVIGTLPALMIYSSSLWSFGLFVLGFFNELAITAIYAYVLNVSGSKSGTLGLAAVNSGEILGGVALFALAGADMSQSFALAVLVSLVELFLLVPYARVRSLRS
jgi:MFS family permease